MGSDYALPLPSDRPDLYDGYDGGPQFTSVNPIGIPARLARLVEARKRYDHGAVPFNAVELEPFATRDARVVENTYPLKFEQVYISLAAEIVSAYVSNNSIAARDLPSLISVVHSALSRVTIGSSRTDAVKPAVPPEKSITAEFIISLEDGRKFKSLKRHLKTKYNMSPEEYRAKWGLPADYPMVAAAYAIARSRVTRASVSQTLRQKSKDELKLSVRHN